MWFDGDWVEWWNNDVGTDLYNYIRGLKPDIIINNRVAKRDLFKKDFGTPEQFHPANRMDHVWEACYTMNGSWGYKINDNNWKTAEMLYDKLKDINGKGGNLLLNIGPDGDGNVPTESVEILKELGKMLQRE
jgi:alpha-L-fucosidase